MKNIILLISVFIQPLASLAGGGCNNIYPVITPDGLHLIFSSDRHGGNYEIYKSDLDGTSNLIRLTNTSVNNFFASVSPDGSKIVFQSGDYGASSEIFIMNSDGTGLTNLTNNSGYDGYPNFSPNGQKIVFDAWDVDQYPEIFTMDVNGANRTQLTNVPGANWQCSPIYNPSGTYIYFQLAYNADNHLARMDLNGSNIIDITPPNAFGIADFGQRFSPDGTQLIFGTTEYEGYNNGSDVVISDTLGGNWNRITNSVAGEYFYCPVWHPSNNKIYYGHYTNTNMFWEIYEMSTAGTNNLLLSDCLNSGINGNSMTAEAISVFPVPAESEVNFTMPVGTIAEMYDATGRIVLSTTASKIDISKLESGFYSVRFLNNDGQFIRSLKVIKKYIHFNF